MSFADKIIPRLGQSVEDDPEWYVKAMYQSLTEYLIDLERLVDLPTFYINGVTTVPSTPPVPTPIMAPVGKIFSTGSRFTYEEVKAAMWCGDGSLTFPNLFRLFAKNLMLDFTSVYDNTIVNAMSPLVFDAITSYEAMGNEFMMEMRTVGAAGEMTPEIFHKNLSLYLNLAFNSIVTVTIPMAGMGLVPTGPFTGTVAVVFSQVMIV